MIIARTPLRISYLGGGTDLPAFYLEEEGATLSSTIDKYVYLTINDRFDETYRLAYSKTEICASIEDIEHDIFRAVLRKYDGETRARNGGRGLELISMADIPAGTGLGSSSSFTVSLLHAVNAHHGRLRSAEELATEACRIEIDDLKEPIGKQDQFAAANGGLQFLRFLPSGQVIAEPIVCSRTTKAACEASTMLFYTGMTRPASRVLSERRKNTQLRRETLRVIRDLAYRMKRALENASAMSTIGELLHEGWKLKKTLADGISVERIDEWYERAVAAGAWGGKIVGAGGGGFLMIYCDPERQARIRQELKELRHLPIRFESFGSRILFVDQ